MNAATFLQLAPEFGGTKYGPFRGVEIRLGSDPESNDISMPADLGVLPQHVKILQQNDQTYIVAPVERTATVFIWRQGSNKPKQITTPIAVGVGDGFSLVTPEGHRFYILNEALKRKKELAGGGFADKAMKRMPTSRGLLEEVKRRGFAKVFTTRLGNSAMYAYRFVATGQIFSPMYIVAGIMMISGWFFASGATCSAFSLNGMKNDYAQKLRTCEDQRDGVEEGDRGVSVPSLVTHLLADNDWRMALRNDPDLYKEVAKQLRIAFSRPTNFEVHYKNSNSEFAKLHRALASGTTAGFTNTLAYTGALGTTTRSREWRVIEDSEGKEVCGRGPLALTYRQAINLGLENVQLDALVTSSVAESRNMVEKQEFLLATAEAARQEDVSLAGTVIVPFGGASVAGGKECMHLEGQDDRTDIPALARAIKRKLGPNASGLPDESYPNWLALRLYKLAAMDFTVYDDLKFNTQQSPSTYLASQPGVGQKRTDFATRYTSRTIAQAIVTRCSATLDKDLQDAPPEHMGKLPELIHCAYIKTLVEYDRID